MRIRTFYDSTNTGDLPRSAANTLRYVDGLYADTEANIRRHCPRAERVVGITVLGGDAIMADVEPGDLTPSSGARWAKRQLDTTGVPHTLYFPLSWHDAVVAACKAVGLKPGKTVLFFAARYGHDQTIPAGYVGVQYASPDGPIGTRSGGHYDISAVVPYWEGVDPKPVLAGLRHGPRRNARALKRELLHRTRHDRAYRLTAPKDRVLVKELLAALRGVLRGGK